MLLVSDERLLNSDLPRRDTLRQPVLTNLVLILFKNLHTAPSSTEEVLLTLRASNFVCCPTMHPTKALTHLTSGEVLRIGVFLLLWLPHIATAWTIRAATAQDIGLARKVLLEEAMNPLSVSTEYLLVAAAEDEPDAVLGFGQIRPLDGTDYTELASLYVFPDHRREGIASALIESLLERQQQADDASSVCLLTLRPTMPLYEKFGFGAVDPKRDDDTWKALPQTVRLEYQAGSLLSLFLGNDLVCMVR